MALRKKKADSVAPLKANNKATTKKEKKAKQKQTQEAPKQANLTLIQNTADFKYKYDADWENKEFLDIVKIVAPKAILYGVQNNPIALANGYSGYLQIMEVYGKDIAALSDNERDGAILSFTQWLSGTPFDTQIQSTTLPTNTRIQIEELVRIQEQVRYDLLDPDLTDKERWQLNQRADILATHILQLEVVAAVQYNTEFFIWIFGDTLEELESYTRLASSVSYGFRPHVVSVSKKDQILKQYYNYNESV